MNKSPQAIGFICRNCLGKVGKAVSSRKAFSTTTSNWKGIPSFAPSSTPELDAVLNNIREKLFIPDALSPQHRRLVYRPTKQSVLTNEPGVTVTIGDDEEIKLVPLNHGERPSRRTVFTKIRSLLANSQDDIAWQNVFPLMEGLKDSKANTTDAFPEQLATLAVMQGRSKYIVRLFDQPKRTGFTLGNPGLARAFMFACHTRAGQLHFKGEEVEAIARDIEHVARLMERDDHCGGLHKTRSDTGTPTFDSRQSLVTIGVLLEMAAAKAINEHGGKDVDGRVADYLTKALALSERGIDDGTTPHIWRRIGRNEENDINFNERPELAVLLDALNMAAKVDGIPSEHQRRALNARLTTLVERLDHLNERSRQLYKEREQKKATRSS